MSDAARHAPAPLVAPAAALDWLRRPAPSVFVGLLLIVALGAAKTVAVWRTGAFFDTDDAMRLVQVRDWLAGQGWSDLTQHRMNPPAGLPMHWSRVVDIPLAALLTGLTPLLGPDLAARATRLVFPLAMLACYLAMLTALARRMTDARGGLVVALLAATLLVTNGQFDPGRIDHHAPQITLLVAMTLATVVSLDPARASRAAWAGFAAATSLAISVENVPFIAATAAAFGAAALLTPATGRAAAVFGASFAASAAAMFAVFAPDWTSGACDAFSRFHLFAAMLGGGGLAALGAAASRGASGPARLGLALAAGAAVAACAILLFPACLRDPLANVPDELRRLWLDNVSEARPLSLLLARRPDLGLPAGAPLLAGLLAALFAAKRTSGVARARWFALFAILLAGLAATVWQVRAATSALPLAAVAGAFVSLAASDRFAAVERPLARLAPVAAALPFAGLFWLIVAPAPSPRAENVASGSPEACFAPAAYAGLAKLPAGRVLSSVDAGSFILAGTPHSVFAGAYHRNVAGNLLAIRTLTADPAAARAAMARENVAYLALCPDLVDVQIYAEQAPQGLAARVLRGETPEWLEAVAAPGPMRIFRVH